MKRQVPASAVAVAVVGLMVGGAETKWKWQWEMMVMLIVVAVSRDDARLTSLTVGLDHDLMRCAWPEHGSTLCRAWDQASSDIWQVFCQILEETVLLNCPFFGHSELHVVLALHSYFSFRIRWCFGLRSWLRPALALGVPQSSLKLIAWRRVAGCKCPEDRWDRNSWYTTGTGCLTTACSQARPVRWHLQHGGAIYLRQFIGEMFCLFWMGSMIQQVLAWHSLSGDIGASQFEQPWHKACSWLCYHTVLRWALCKFWYQLSSGTSRLQSFVEVAEFQSWSDEPDTITPWSAVLRAQGIAPSRCLHNQSRRPNLNISRASLQTPAPAEIEAIPPLSCRSCSGQSLVCEIPGWDVWRSSARPPERRQLLPKFTTQHEMHVMLVVLPYVTAMWLALQL